MHHMIDKDDYKCSSQCHCFTRLISLRWCLEVSSKDPLELLQATQTGS